MCGEENVLPTLASTASPYTPCNSITPATASSSAAPTTNSNYWVYTSTNMGNGQVVACQSTSMAYWGDVPETYCAGTSLTLYAPPSVTATIATATHVNVGTLTGAALYTSVSNALETLCPTPSNNAYTSCNNNSISIPDVVYWSGNDAEGGDDTSNGDLQVTVPLSSYNSSDLRSAMIQSVALATNTSAQGSSCYNLTSTCAISHVSTCDPQTFQVRTQDHLSQVW